MSSAGAESAAAVGTESTDADRRSGHAERRNTAALAAGLAATTAVVALGLLPAVASALPQDISPPRALVAGEDFAPRKPGFEGLDWILLNSGEWLRGSVDRIRDESLEFDSEELDSLNLDFADVYAVVTAGPHTVNLEGRRIVTGEVVIRDDVLRLRTAEGVLTFPRAEIVGMVSGEQRERNYWSGTVSVGLSLQRGNTNTSNLTSLSNITRETALTRANAKYNGAIGTVSGRQNANNHRVTAQGDVFLTRRFFITVLYFEYFTDEFQNVDLRLTPAAGVGYKLVDRSRVDVEISLAAGAQYQEDETPAFPGADTTRTTASIIMGMEFSTDLTENVEWNGVYNLQLGVPQTAETNHHALTTLSVDLLGDLDLDLTFVWHRNQSPSIQSDGTIPVQNDYRVSAGLGWDF